MSFQRTTPGMSKGSGGGSKPTVAKSIQTTGVVTANRNPNRPQINARPQEEIDAENENKEDELIENFREMVKADAQKERQSKLSQFPSSNSNTAMQLAMMQAQQKPATAPQAPKIPSMGGSSSSPTKSNNSSSNKGSTKKPDGTPQSQKVNPLRRPGESQNQGQQNQIAGHPANKDSVSMPPAFGTDARRIASLRGGSPADSLRISNKLYRGYQGKVDMSDSTQATQARRLIAHGISHDQARSVMHSADLTNQLISSKNAAFLAKAGDNKTVIGVTKSLGFDKKSLSQADGKQYLMSVRNLQESVEARATYNQAKKDGSLTPEMELAEQARIKNQVLMVLTKDPKGIGAHDVTREFQDLVNLGKKPIMLQANSDTPFHKTLADGSSGQVKALTEQTGPAHLMAWGHGQNSKTPALRLGSQADGEKAYVDAMDLQGNSEIAALFKDKSVIPEGGTIAFCSCSSLGSSADEFGGDHIKPEESIAALTANLRPDANVLGGVGKIDTHGRFNEENGQLVQTTLKRVDGPDTSLDADTQELVAQANESAQSAEEDASANIANLLPDFGEEEDEEFDTPLV